MNWTLLPARKGSFAGGQITKPFDRVKAFISGEPNHEIGSTDSSGNLLIPDLLPYFGNKLRISDQDLPIDFSINVTEILLAPSLRGGALAEFTAERVTFSRGRARVRRGDEETIPVYGQISVAKGGGTVESPIGNDGKFELAGLPSGRYMATITYKGGTCAAPLDIPKSEDLITDIGLFTCAKEARSAHESLNKKGSTP
jgi:outer membrane usher protein